MPRNNHFRHGVRVNGISLAGKKVLGEYRGMRSSFGALVYGLEEGCTELDMHVCLALTLRHVIPERVKKAKTKLEMQAGDLCSGRTKRGDLIEGKYMNREGQHSWIKGWQEGTNKLSPPQAFKVLTATLEKL